MFIPLYNARGVLTAPLRKSGLVLAVDADLRSLLNTLGVNHTYLRLEGEGGVEIVKVSADTHSVNIVREIDNTEALTFNTGDTVEYTTTVAGIQESLPSAAISAYGREAIEVEDNVIRYAPFSITLLGAEELIGEGAKLTIARREKAYGCCGSGNEAAPVSPVPFYLTSWTYPVNVLESINSDATFTVSLTGAGAIEYLDSSAELLSGALTVTVAYETYDKVLEELDSSAELLSGALIVTVGYVTYSNWSSDSNSEKLDSYADLISGSLPVVVGYITYDYWNPALESLDSSAELVSGVLA